MNGIQFTAELGKILEVNRMKPADQEPSFSTMNYQSQAGTKEIQTSIFIFDFKSQKLLCTEEYRISDTNCIPEVIIKNWFDIEQSELNYEMYSRLLKLANRPDEWRGRGSRKLEASSLSGFLKFWQKIKKFAVEPDLVLLPNGNLQAEWYKSDKHFFEIEFTPDQYLIFGLFDGKKIYEGIGSSTDVLSIATLNSSKAVKWTMG